MKIAHIIWGIETGGAETMLVDIINEQVRKEKVALYVVNDLINQQLLNKIDKRCDIKLFRRKIGSKNFMPWIMLNVYLIKYNPDVIHFHLEGMRKMVFHPAPKVFTIHNMYTSGVEYHKYQALYAISNAVKERTKKQGFESTTIWNGIHPDSIQIKQKIIGGKKPFYRFVCVGRLYTPHKGQDILIHALSILKSKNITNYHLDLIGEGESKKQLESMISKMKLDSHVTMLGQRDRMYVYSHLCKYDLFILPSRSEGFGLSLAEAMCAKVPVLTSDLEGPMEVIDNGRLGMFFKSEDSEDLATKIESYMERGENSYILNAAYDFAKMNFDIDITAQQYLTAYRNLFHLK